MRYQSKENVFVTVTTLTVAIPTHANNDLLNERKPGMPSTVSGFIHSNSISIHRQYQNDSVTIKEQQ